MRDEANRPEDLRTRTKRFALRVIRLYSALPKTTEAQVMGKQLLRSGTSVGAHYNPYSGKVLGKSAFLRVCVALANSVVAENICKKLLKMDKKLI